MSISKTDSVDYSAMEADFYEGCVHSSNFPQSWFHNSRNSITYGLVSKYYFDGALVMDIGCGNVLWNKDKIPVTGVDVNERFLDFNLKRGTISKKIVSSAAKIDIPADSADIVVLTEVLEHMHQKGEVLEEIRRILKIGGILICSVPYDAMLSLWRPLFSLQCLYMGGIRGDAYYKAKCGHVNRFSPESLRSLVEAHKMKQLFSYNHYFLTIFSVSEKA